MLCCAVFRCHYSNEAAFPELKSIFYGVFNVSEEFSNAAVEFSVFVRFKPINRIDFVLLRLHDERLFDKRTRFVEVVDLYRLNRLAFEHRHNATQNVRNVFNNQRISQIGLIRSVISYCVEIRDAFKRRSVDFLIRKFSEQIGQNILKHLEHVLLSSKRHFHIQLIEFARAAIRSCVFVSKARRYLKILIESARHQKLFVLLRSLR